MPFIVLADHMPRLLERETVISQFVKTQEQPDLFQIAA
jgi:hypothetical protein